MIYLSSTLFSGNVNLMSMSKHNSLYNTMEIEYQLPSAKGLVNEWWIFQYTEPTEYG